MSMKNITTHSHDGFSLLREKNRSGSCLALLQRHLRCALASNTDRHVLTTFATRGSGLNFHGRRPTKKGHPKIQQPSSTFRDVSKPQSTCERYPSARALGHRAGSGVALAEHCCNDMRHEARDPTIPSTPLSTP